MISRHTFIQRIRELWFAPDLMQIQQRRERRMVIASGTAMMLMGALWAVFFVIRGYWFIVALDMVLILAGLTVLVLTWFHQARRAAIVLFTALLVVVGVIAAIVDVPSAQVQRSTHLYLLPLSVAALMAFRDERGWLRHGLAISCLLVFTLLASYSGTPLPGISLPDSVRGPGTWIQVWAAMLMLYALIHILQTDATQRSALEGELLQALALRQFQLHYQPQVDHHGQVIGAEALLRWAHPQRGLVMPGQFIGAAEQSGLILPMGSWVLETACAQLRTWASDPALSHLCLAVNISQKQFRQTDFVSQVTSLIDQYQIDASRLELELTETMLVDDMQEIHNKMSALGARGITFSLDDFGTGYSSLSHLKKLPLNKLKIDQSFVADVLTDPHSAAIVRTVVALGQSMGLDVIAEGVETQDQRQFLLDNGCLQYQGYWFSCALPADTFEAYVKHPARTPATRRPQTT